MPQNKIVCDIRHTLINIRNQANIVHFEWIPGYCGIYGNEKADFLAKQATHIDDGKVTGAIFLDLKKAFDTVDHSILLCKLNEAGVYGTELKWFESYLGDRQQATHVDGKLSKLDNIKTGVPQGSIIGPLLFVIFINSLPSCVTGTGSKVHMYADDTMIMFSGSNTNELQKVMNRGLDQVANWLQHHKLTLNANKTKFMIFGTQRRVSVFSNKLFRFLSIGIQ